MMGVGLDAKSRSFSFRHGAGAPCPPDAKTAYRICGQFQKVKARSLLCYWAVRETGISLRTLAKRLRISAPMVGYAMERGEAIVREGHYELIQ